MNRFVDSGRDCVDGWISHYFGHTIEEHVSGAEPFGTSPDAPFRVTVADFLRFWRDKGKIIAGTSPEGNVRQANPLQVPQPPPTASLLAPQSGLIVRGSVEQIYIVHAKPNSSVTVQGPRGFQTTASADDKGGLVFRDVPPGDGYRVMVEGSDQASPSVRVLGREEHPAKSFYSSQNLEPTRGYVKTRDGTLLSYRVVLPDGHEMLVQSGWLRASHRALDVNTSTVLRPQHLHTAESLETLNDDVRKTLNGTFQVRLSSLESCKKFLVRNVMTALAHAHGDSLD